MVVARGNSVSMIEALERLGWSWKTVV
jgi:hypothetical protein